jgi:16S rRNA (cytidine1402-2'-O)-methyltransferase
MSRQPEIALVALPIGNAQDISLRAIDTLNKADLIFCEDTRKIGELSKHVTELQIKAQLKPVPGDSEWELDFAKYFEFKRWVLVSDAGTPVVNDPGRALIEFARKKSWVWVAVPGPSAPMMSLHWSGGFGLPFGFGGFAPKVASHKSLELKQFFAVARALKSFVFFDTKHQVLTTLEHLMHDDDWSKARLILTREMTKTHEELVYGTASTLHQELSKRVNSKEGVGELTFVIEGQSQAPLSKSGVVIADLAKIRNASPSDAAKLAALLTGLDRKAAYEALTQKDTQ